MLDLLIAKQQELGLSDYRFAQRLNVPRSTWQLTRTKKKVLSERIVRRAMWEFGDLSTAAVSFLLSDDTTVAKKDTQSTKQDDARPVEAVAGG